MSKPNLSDPKVKKDVEDNKVVAAIGYIGILCLIPLLLKPKSAFAKFHGKQGLILVVAWVINFFIGIIPVLGWLLAFIGTIALIILSLLGIIKALAGEYWQMPYLSDYAEKIKL